MTLPEILDRLGPHKRAGGGFLAKCPAHEDRVESLSVSEGDGGRVLLKCHAGCDTGAVLERVGLKPSDLFNDARRREIVKTYDYVDADGKVLYQTCRMHPKGFFQRRADGRGGWINGLDGTPRVLYRLPDVLEAVACDKRVFVVEGEKDADTLVRHGFCATTGAMGAGKWRPEYTAALEGADVVVLPDNDDPGRDHAAKVAAALQGKAKRVVVLELPNLPPKGDVSDWFAAGGTADELWRLVEAGPERTAATPRLVCADVLNAPDPPPPVFQHGPWRGCYGLVTAESGRGKSIVALELGITVACGTTLLPSFGAIETGSVAYLSYEDSPCFIRTRLQNLGRLAPGLEDKIHEAVKVGRLMFYCDPPTLFEPAGMRGIKPAEGFNTLDAFLAEMKPLLVIIDPLSGAAELSDENSNAEMMAVGRHLARLAEKHQCIILLIHHTSKARADEATQHNSRGGAGLACRARWMVTLTSPKQAEDDDLLQLTVVKDSYHKKPKPVFLTRGEYGELRERERETVSPLELAAIVAQWLTENPEAVVTKGGLLQNQGIDAKNCRLAVVTRYPWATGSDIAEAVRLGIKQSVLAEEYKSRPNRTQALALVPVGGRNG